MKFLIPLYAVTLFVSAFLLFSVQPMVGKFLLPLLGGGTSVWNTAMLFFQLLLLCGYGYAFAMARFIRPKYQTYIHICLFILGALSLPLNLPADADPSGSNPMLWQLTSMLLMAAGPFFILSSTAPLLQQWFSRTAHEKSQNPYFLYVASNIGSILALLSYPFIIEPLLRLRDQSALWSWGYGLLACLLAICALSSKFLPLPARSASLDTQAADTITWRRRGSWLFLAFVPSSLMLGVTSFITTDVTAVPLFWVIPLSLYLLSFIIAFSEKPFFTLPLTRIVHSMVALMLLSITMLEGMMTAWNVAVLHTVFFFFTALLCHQEMAALKPKAKDLTEFYLIMSLGGALGGVFNSLLAPLLFKVPLEYSLTIILGLLCRYASDPLQKGIRNTISAISQKLKTDWRSLDWKAPLVILITLIGFIIHQPALTLIGAVSIPVIFFFHQSQRWIFAALFSLTLVINPLIPWNSFTHTLAIERNYYGSVLVNNIGDVRAMTHGVTNHGAQSTAKAYEKYPTAYYAPGSGASDIFSALNKRPAGAQKIAALGMGVGTIACYSRADRFFDFYEINPVVISIATNKDYFTFLTSCGSPYQTIEGDARRKIAASPDHSYDIIFVDVFSSDNIPMHIITTEAVALYQQKLKSGGALVFHISNRFFRLDREIAAIGAAHDLKVLGKRSVHKEQTIKELQHPLMGLDNYYTVMTNNEDFIAALKAESPEWKDVEPDPTVSPWSDDYANILRALILK